MAEQLPISLRFASTPFQREDGVPHFGATRPVRPLAPHRLSFALASASSLRACISAYRPTSPHRHSRPLASGRPGGPRSLMHGALPDRLGVPSPIRGNSPFSAVAPSRFDAMVLAGCSSVLQRLQARTWVYANKLARRTKLCACCRFRMSCCPHCNHIRLCI